MVWLGSIIVAACITYATRQSVAQQAENDPRSRVYLNVGDDFQSIVNAYPAGTHFIVRSGIHREQKVIPQDGDVFTGEPGAVMKGSRVLTGWQAAGSNWVTTLMKPIAPGLENGWCSDYGENLQDGDVNGVEGSIRLGLSCVYPEMLFVTDTEAHASRY